MRASWRFDRKRIWLVWGNATEIDANTGFRRVLDVKIAWCAKSLPRSYGAFRRGYLLSASRVIDWARLPELRNDSWQHQMPQPPYA